MISRRRWSDEEVEYLRKHAEEFSSEYIGLRLKRTSYAVRSKAQELKISFGRWKEEETEFLRLNAKKLTAKQIAKHLGKDTSVVVTKAKYEGFKFGPKRRNHVAQQG